MYHHHHRRYRPHSPNRNLSHSTQSPTCCSSSVSTSEGRSGSRANTRLARPTLSPAGVTTLTRAPPLSFSSEGLTTAGANRPARFVSVNGLEVDGDHPFEPEPCEGVGGACARQQCGGRTTEVARVVLFCLVCIGQVDKNGPLLAWYILSCCGNPAGTYGGHGG